jgi:hypothetical protein
VHRLSDVAIEVDITIEVDIPVDVPVDVAVYVSIDISVSLHTAIDGLITPDAGTRSRSVDSRSACGPLNGTPCPTLSLDLGDGHGKQQSYDRPFEFHC